MELFRFLTAGSVDDGKSTLIGHLLHLVDSLRKDQVERIKALDQDENTINYALFTDGLKAERELGITIDVSYQYFSTEKRRFIIADCPGHKEYTRNMFTGASTADLLVLMVNVKNGITEQTLRHLNIGLLLNIPNLIVCINKMDLANYEKPAFDKIQQKITNFLADENLDVSCIPVSATNGDNLVDHSDRMPWYTGKTLLQFLHSSEKREVIGTEACFPVQYTIDHNGQCFTMGTAVEGSFSQDEKIKILPQNSIGQIKEIYQSDEPVVELKRNAYGSLRLEGDMSINRGAIIVSETSSTVIAQEAVAKICWMDEIPLNPESIYTLKCATQEVNCRIDLELNGDEKIEQNSIFDAKVVCEKPIVFNSYKVNQTLGAFILIDKTTHQTVAGGTIQ